MPGQNSWTESPSEAVVYRSMDSATQQREKRQRVDAEATDIMDYDVISIFIICILTVSSLLKG